MPEKKDKPIISHRFVFALDDERVSERQVAY
jgi:hypothetical protein